MGIFTKKERPSSSGFVRGLGVSTAKPSMTQLADFPEWVEAEAKLGELRLKLADLDREHGGTSPVARKLPTAHDHAQELLDKGSVNIPDAAIIDAARIRLQKELGVVRLAIELHERAMLDIRRKLARSICEAESQRFKAILGRLAKAAVEMAKASKEQSEFFGELFDAGVSSPILERAFFAGDWHEGSASFQLAQILRAAINAGAINEGDALVPEQLRATLLAERERDRRNAERAEEAQKFQANLAALPQKMYEQKAQTARKNAEAEHAYFEQKDAEERKAIEERDKKEGKRLGRLFKTFGLS